MPELTIKLPPQQTQDEFNLRRWNELLTDREMLQFEGCVETDRFGHVIKSPPPAASHGSFQAQIGILLNRCISNGRVVTVCPVSTADGVRAADVAWASPERIAELGNRVCFPRAPEICVEVLSPGNTDAGMSEKTALYFDAGAEEVWLCSESGAMTFFQSAGGEAVPQSLACPDFPKLVKLK